MVAKVLSSKIGELPCFEDEWHSEVHGHFLETNAIPLAEALRKARGDVTLELFPDVGHSVYAMGKPIEERLRSFFSTSI